MIPKRLAIIPVGLFLMAGCINHPKSSDLNSSNDQRSGYIGALSIEKLLNPEAKPLPPNRFTAITNKLNLGQILALLGPAKKIESKGEFLTKMSWYCTDGRPFHVLIQQWRGDTIPLESGFLQKANLH